MAKRHGPKEPGGTRRAYTLGHSESYDRGLREQVPGKPLLKQGRGDNYSGGWIWETEATAQAFLNSPRFAAAFPGRDSREFAVYEVELPTGWAADVSAAPDPSDGVHRLINHAAIKRRMGRDTPALA